MIQLQSTFLQFSCEPEQARWSLRPVEREFPSIQQARLSLRYYSGGLPREGLGGAWRVADASGPTQETCALGGLHQVRLLLRPDVCGLQTTLEFGLAERYPLLLWRMTVANRGKEPAWIDRLELLEVGHAGGSRLQLSPQAGALAFYSNGWQSWCYSGVYGADEVQKRSHLGPIQGPMTVNPGTPQPRRSGHYASDMFALLGDRSSRSGILAGFLAQKEHFGTVEARTQPVQELRLWANGDGARLDAGAEMATDWVALQFVALDDADPLGVYLEAAGLENGVDWSRQPVDIPEGWCSWYEFYQDISAEKIRKNLETVARLQPELPLKLVQIDDGFERQPGDWHDFRAGFPQGVEPLAREIRQAGLTPGLWLAPFIVHPQANLVKQHPEYLLRNRLGGPVNAGFVWNTFTRAMDLTHPGALEYACKTVETAVNTWGFPYLKLDFLYAGALAGRHYDPTRTRAQVIRHGMEALRQAAGVSTYLLGCGAPLGPALGLFQAMRIGADVSGEWMPRYLSVESIFKREPHMPCTRNALQNILSRAPMHRRWWVNDPDCLIVRPTANLSLAEIQTLATAIALSGGSLLLSDNLPALPAERLRIAEVLLPSLGIRPQQPGWFDVTTPDRLRLDLDGPAGAWHVLALFNWEEAVRDVWVRPADFGLSLAAGSYLARSFWEQKNIPAQEEGFFLPGIAPHGVALVALRPVRPGQPVYLGSDLHISQGMEIEAWEADAEGLRVAFHLPRRTTGQVDLVLPRTPRLAWLEGNDLSWMSCEGSYRFRVAFDHRAVFEIKY
ncbi:MAG: alpha-galactosidase [Anaerolineaceae bacterium]|nr:alpha-galactosidase [Anaerolineaceae bacterium]